MAFLIEGSEFPHLMRGEKILWSVDRVRVRDGEGRETDEGILYVTNMRLIFHGKPASFSKNLKKGGRSITALSFFLENVGKVRALRDSRELEVEYHVDSRLSSLSCIRVIFEGLTEPQIGRIILLVEEFKEEHPASDATQEEGRRPQGVLSRILEVINPDEGRKSGDKRSIKQISLGISKTPEKKEAKVKKEEEELLRIPSGLEVEGEIELV
ncbi:MAG: hypothetical protein KIH01_08820, partial [Candidatus Freyarchaeota archaeon]|nr:hypothetical protein [Candidatus Jordarchaeia archaeon]